MSNTPELILTPEQIEKEMIERELQAQKNLSVYAEFFQLYTPRFSNQVKFMNKKDLLRLIESLVGSEYNETSEVNKLYTYAKSLNINSILRSLLNAFQEGLEKSKEDIKQFSKNEVKFFNLLNALLSNKYIKSIQNVDPNQPPKVIDEVIKHIHSKTEFNKRKKVEKDAFATANMLLYTKAMMVNYTVLEYMQENAVELNKEEGK
jgi:hypothetical protein